MTALGKIFGIAFLPFSIIMMLDALDIFSPPFAFSVILIGALLMIAFQVINLLFAKTHNGHISFFQILTAIVFVAPAIYFLLSTWIPYEIPSLPLILSVMMLMEGLYALH